MFPPAAMNASRDTRLRALFDQALDLDGAAREALLARECEGDPELRHRLGDDPKDPQLIKTVRGEGYVLAVTVTGSA